MSATPRVLVANAGTLHLFPLAAELHRHGLLKQCATTLHFERRWFDLMPRGLRQLALKQTVNRRCAELDGMVETMVWPELLHLAAERLHIGKPSEWIAWRNRLFCQYVAERCLDGVNLVWSFDTSSYELFVEAK